MSKKRNDKESIHCLKCSLSWKKQSEEKKQNNFVVKYDKTKTENNKMVEGIKKKIYKGSKKALRWTYIWNHAEQQ